MAKPKKKYPKCPCCLTERNRTEMKVCLSILEKIERKEFKHYKEWGIDPYNSFIGDNFEWACDTCLNEKKAILANPGLQTFVWSPNLAYFDSEKVCRTCGKDFKFTKEEKQLWYEKLKFWMDSEPVNCLQCRRELRVLKAENKILSGILQKAEKEITVDELKTVADIYRKWDKPEKVKFYEAMTRKKQR
jgi:hypothetical protein